MDHLSQFNRQVLQCQDDAYTLAWYLLGNEAQAEAVTQAAVESTYPCFASNRTDCRLLILKQVAKQWLVRRPDACSSAEASIYHELGFLPIHEREVLLLIDVLGLSYPEAACVLERPMKEIMRLLAHARWKLTDQQKVAD